MQSIDFFQAIPFLLGLIALIGLFYPKKKIQEVFFLGFTHLKKPQIYGFFWDFLLRFYIRKINFLIGTYKKNVFINI